MLLTSLLMLTLITACQTTQNPQLATGNVGRLMRRSDYAGAKKNAPEWSRDALHTVNGLESDNEKLQVLLRESTKK